MKKLTTTNNLFLLFLGFYLLMTKANALPIQAHSVSAIRRCFKQVENVFKRNFNVDIDKKGVCMSSSKKIYELGLVLPESNHDLGYTHYKRKLVYTHDEFKQKKLFTSDRTILTFEKDEISMDLHFGTHIDALCHCGEYHGDQFKNNPLTSEGIPMFFEQALIIDIPEMLGIQALEPNFTISSSLIKDWCSKNKLKIGDNGKIVLIRTGHIQHRLRGDYATYYKASAGIDIDAAKYLQEQGVVAVGADNFAIERIPNAQSDFYPVHRFLLVKKGTYLIENLNLEDVTKEGFKQCFFIAAPIRVYKGTAAILNPLAVCSFHQDAT